MFLTVGLSNVLVFHTFHTSHINTQNSVPFRDGAKARVEPTIPFNTTPHRAPWLSLLPDHRLFDLCRG